MVHKIADVPGLNWWMKTCVVLELAIIPRRESGPVLSPFFATSHPQNWDTKYICVGPPRGGEEQNFLLPPNFFLEKGPHEALNY